MQSDPVLLPDGPLIDANRLEPTLGWTLKPEGLCRQERCVAVPDRQALEHGDKIDAATVAELLDRPYVIDDVSNTAAIGAPRAARRSALNDLQAPDFTLSDLGGTEHSLSDHRGKKRLLVAFASW